MAASPFVINVTDDSFAAEVVERSRRTPVIVDFWAPWCAPCRSLAPLLERVVAEQNGAVVLAKVNADENPGAAGQFAAEGIPAVYGVRDGRIVNQFLGLLPEEDVRTFVTGLLPSGIEKQLQEALLLEGSDPAKAATAYRAILAVEPKNEPARVGLARVLLARDGKEDEATELLAGIEIGPLTEEVERLRTIVQLREEPHGDKQLAEAEAAAKKGEEAEARYQLGAVRAARGDYVPALDALLAAAELDKALARTRVKELMVKVFQVIGSRSETADEYRRKLQSMLY